MQLRFAATASAIGLALVATTTAAQAETVVTMWSFLDPSKTSPREVALQQMIDDFEAANPGVRVVVEPQIFSELGVKFLLGHNTGNAPDVVFVNTENLGALMMSGSTADLQEPFLGSWSAEEDGDFYIRAGWEAALVDGKRYAVPLFHATESIFYRKDLFEEAGIDADSLRTWDVFSEAAKKLTTDEVWGFGTPISPERTGGTTAILSMIIGAQGDAWDRESCEPRYATEAGVRTIQLHADWINEHRIMPSDVLINNTDDIMDQFAAGRYAMVLAPFARYARARADATWDPDQLGLLPFPNWTDERSGPQRVAGWWVAAWSNSPQLEEAAAWIEHMISPESVRLWSVVGGQVPTRTSIFADEEFRKPDYDYMQAMVDAWGDWSWILPINCNTARFDADLNVAVHRVALGEVDPMAALEEAEEKFRERQ